MVSTFVAQRLALNARIEDAAVRPASLPRSAVITAEFKSRRAAIAQRQAIGDPPRAANDNAPTPVPARVRPSKATSIRGALADCLPMLLAYYRTPDHRPEPVTSSWSVDPSSVIPENEQSGETGRRVSSAEDLAIDIRPSVAYIMAQVADNPVVRGAPRPVQQKRRRQPSFGPIVEIGKLKFSDGTSTHRITERTDAGIVTTAKPAPAGVMLGTSERLAGRHGGDSASVARLSNTRTVALFFGRDDDDRPNNWRSFIAANPVRRKGKNLTVSQSRELIAAAIANTPVMPPVTKCPPGVASGTARFSDQFIGLVSGSTGKGGAPNWVDHFTAVRDHAEWVDVTSALDFMSKTAIETALTASSRAQVGMAVGQSAEYARRQGGTRALIAANDNLAAIVKSRAC